jgi:hypothetical protein
MAGRPSAAARRGGRDEVITVDAHELRDLIKRIKTVEDRTMRTTMRKALKASADLAVDGVREAVLDGVPAKTGVPTYRRKVVTSKTGKRRLRRVVADVGTREGGRTRSTGLRADLARATSASLLAGSDKGGGSIKITTQDRKLADGHRGMVKGYNAKVFRHPVFADQSHTRDEWAWVYQRGQGNYFGRGVHGKRREMLARLQAAMDDIAEQI